MYMYANKQCKSMVLRLTQPCFSVPHNAHTCTHFHRMLAPLTASNI